MISKAQIQLVQVARRAVGLEEDDYRAILRAEAGVESTKDLDNRGLDRVMKRFEKLGFSHSAKANKRNYQPAALVTPEQQALIATLYARLGWDDQARQMGFNKRCCRKSFPQTRSDANKVIEGQKAVLGRQGSSVSTTT